MCLTSKQSKGGQTTAWFWHSQAFFVKEWHVSRSFALLTERCVVLGKKLKKNLHLLFCLYLNKLKKNKKNKKPLLCFYVWMNQIKKTDLKGQCNLVLFYVVYMWQTLPPFSIQTVFWGLDFPPRAACLFSDGEKNAHFWNYTVSLWTLRP